MGHWIDISQPLHNGMAHWPGDEAFSFNLSATREETGSVNIGQLSTSIHIGTHVDAPFHFIEDGKKTNELDINLYIGRAKLIDLSGEERITTALLDQFPLQNVKRLLIKTSSEPKPKHFPTRVPVISEDVPLYLKKCGVELIGVDFPSVDELDSKALPIHHKLHQHNIHILENIVVHDIAQGDYELIALPLRIEGGDGSPVRAVIRKLEGGGA
ncbi:MULTISPECIES: arylformamidase [Cytobacillus]|uniref:arylformamidase n=1 Tax=Cytobacillus TaxID=2675230 RepID=UPI001CD1C2A8|nr:arylformamidase [Cytobacillus kochii]MCA1025079.1 arylformamidase [Cytobacillus kochii]MCM3324122.1 arylformamidase [Cytobacillus kochii]MCM3346474.1 arylformamidase [Cytobacillus kochii]MDM5206718.1 arylformamidase [Cytobacillus kochii]